MLPGNYFCTLAATKTKEENTILFTFYKAGFFQIGNSSRSPQYTLEEIDWERADLIFS